VFPALTVFLVPTIMKLLNQPPAAAPPAPAPATTQTPTPTPGATPTAGTTPTPDATGGTAAAGADALVVNADLSPAPLDGQLVALTRFTSKDPFIPQDKVAEVIPPSGDATPPKTNPGGSSSGGGFTPGPGTSPPPGSSTPAPAPTLGTISINTVAMAVAVKADFPAAAPMFTLVSLTARAAQISIAGGSLASGTRTVTLPLGKPVTLMNTADGTRFVLVYVGPGDRTTPAAASAGAATTTTGTTTTTTTPTVGTPTPAGRD
jgi:hypothetical protein